MNIKDIKSGYEDMKILIHMADDIDGSAPESGKDAAEAKHKLEYIRSRLLKIAMGNNNILKLASEKLIR